MQPLIPNLWCDGNAEEMAAYYLGIFPDSKIVAVQHYGPDTPGEEGTVMFVEFELFGRRYGAINGGPQFPYSEAVSFEVRCDTQEEIDRVWAGLCDGGEPGPCGWLKDRFGLSWQVNANLLFDLMTGDDEAARNRATQYFLALDKEPFVIADLQAAYDGA